jgi:crotonobetainyl-CoA:carnitine CoA-transferase CaiB-like acyl-CoA transferase
MVRPPEALFDDPHLAARAFFAPVAHPELQKSLLYPGAPYRMSDSPWAVRRRPPLAGEHSEGILRDEIGLDHADIQRLHAAGVVRVPAGTRSV